jgi:hypothetical protein
MLPEGSEPVYIARNGFKLQGDREAGFRKTHRDFVPGADLLVGHSADHPPALHQN